MSDYVGKSIGRYHIVEMLGEGGMATVFKAFDTRLEREVALKIIRSGEESPNFLKRFDREAKALAKLKHNNIVTVLDYGEHDQRPYLVMDYIENGTLKNFLGNPIPWHQAVRLLIPVAKALQYAHDRKIIHRDLKPGNILLNENEEPLLSDFGIAKTMFEGETQALTKTGTGIGTPAYMAPEQGMAQKIDHRVDIYSTGIILFELITGRKPFEADTPMAVIFKHYTDPLPRPRSLVPDLPEFVEQVIFKAVAKDPENRYQSAGDLAKALEKTLVLDQETMPEEAKESQALKEKELLQSSESATVVQTDGGEKELPQSSESATVVQPDKKEKTELPAPIVQIPSAETAVIPETDKQEKPQKKRTAIWIAVGAIVIFALALIAVGGYFFWNSEYNPFTQATATRTERPQAQDEEEEIQQQQPTEPPELEEFVELPVQLNTPLPIEYTMLTASNADQMELIGLLGKGIPYDFDLFNNDENVIVVTALGLYFYDAASFQQVQYCQAEGTVYVVNAVNDGDYFLTGEYSGPARLWDQDCNVLADTTESGIYNIRSLAVSENSEFAAVSNDSGGIYIINKESLDVVRDISHSEFSISSIAWSSDGSILAAGDRSGLIQLWDTSTWEIIRTLESHTDAVYGLAFSPDGMQLVSTGYYEDGQVIIWYLDNYDHYVLEDIDTAMVSAEWSPDMNLLAVGGYDHKIRVYDYMQQGSALLYELEGDTRYIRRLHFTNDSGTLMSLSYSGQVQSWNMNTGTLAKNFDRLTTYIGAGTFAPDLSAIVYTVGYRGEVVKLDLPENSGELLIKDITAYPERVVYSPDGERIAFTLENEGFVIMDMNSGEIIQEFSPIEGENTLDLAFIHGSTEIAALSENRLSVWDIQTGELNVQIDPDDGDAFTCLDYDADRSWMVFGSYYGYIYWFDFENEPELINMISAPDSGYTAVNDLAIVPGENRVAAVFYEPNVAVFNIESSQLAHEIPIGLGDWSYGEKIDISPNGDLIAVGTSDYVIPVFSYPDLQRLTVLGGHNYVIASLEFSPQRKYLLSTGWDGTVRLWGIP